MLCPILTQRNFVDLAWTGERHPTRRVYAQPFRFVFRWDGIGLQNHHRDLAPIHRDSIANGLCVALDTRKPNFVPCPLWDRMDMVSLNTRGSRSPRTGFERYNLKRYSQDLRDLFGEFPIIPEFVASSAQSTSHYLLAEQ